MLDTFFGFEGVTSSVQRLVGGFYIGLGNNGFLDVRIEK